MIKSAAEREAMNMPIQWTSADIIKIAMIRIHQYMQTHNMKSFMIMQVHDELVFDVSPWEEKELEANIVKIMENILETDLIRLKVDMGTGNNRKEAK
jgi:DNA polymerase-1